MSITIPIWIIIALKIIGIVILSLLSILGIMLLLAIKDFKIHW